MIYHRVGHFSAANAACVLGCHSTLNIAAAAVDVDFFYF